MYHLPLTTASAPASPPTRTTAATHTATHAATCALTRLCVRTHARTSPTPPLRSPPAAAAPPTICHAFLSLRKPGASARSPIAFARTSAAVAPCGFSFVLGYCFFYFHYRSEMSGFLQSTFFFACATQQRGDATARRCNSAAMQQLGDATASPVHVQRGRARVCLRLRVPACVFGYALPLWALAV